MSKEKKKMGWEKRELMKNTKRTISITLALTHVREEYVLPGATTYLLREEEEKK